MRRVRLLAIGVGALTVAACPYPTGPRQIGVGGGGGGTRLLVFVVQPSDAPSGSIIVPFPQVAVEDSLGVVDTTATGGVTVALTTAGGATLGGTTTVTLASGIATFDNLTVDLTGSYTLTASSSGRTGAISTAFNITP
jgi:hypothetical protein